MTFRGAAGLVDSGGGIYNCFGTLTVIDSIITGNRIRGGNPFSVTAAASITALAAP